jgi:MFS family permease
MARYRFLHGRSGYVSLVSLDLILAFVLPFGQFSMIFPAKWFYIFMVVLFEVGSAVCGAAPNMNALIVGRVIAGIGAVGIYTGALFLISVNTSEEERYLDDHNFIANTDRNTSA